MTTMAACSWNEAIEVEFGGPVGPRVLYPQDLEDGEIEEALAELAPGWDGDWQLQVETDCGRYAAPIFWTGA